MPDIPKQLAIPLPVEAAGSPAYATMADGIIIRSARLARMLYQENCVVGGIERVVEPNRLMQEEPGIASFHGQGSGRGALAPIYHLNANSVSRLLPHGGRVLDLGTGSGRFLATLARMRPDARLVGLDLSDRMLSVGRRYLRVSGLASRVKLIHADMQRFASVVDDTPDVVTSVYSLHHLPSLSALRECLDQIAEVRARSGCAIWLFDHVRPQHAETARTFPEIFTLQASRTFRRDSRNSLLASFSFARLSAILDEALPRPPHHQQSKWIRLFQAHWQAGTHTVIPNAVGDAAPCELTDPSRRAYRRLRRLFRRLP